MTWIPQPGGFVQPIIKIPCHRRGTMQLGGHCVYCGFDVAPYACVQYDDDIVICRTKCWKDLIDVDFPNGLDGILSEKVDHTGLADPKPHYDDCRRVAGKFDNGAEFVIELCSGQSNYYGGLEIVLGNELLYSDVLEEFDALDVEASGDTYSIEVIWE